jgi:hypothetical protein
VVAGVEDAFDEGVGHRGILSGPVDGEPGQGSVSRNLIATALPCSALFRRRVRSSYTE